MKKLLITFPLILISSHVYSMGRQVPSMSQQEFVAAMDKIGREKSAEFKKLLLENQIEMSNIIIRSLENLAQGFAKMMSDARPEATKSLGEKIEFLNEQITKVHAQKKKLEDELTTLE